MGNKLGLQAHRLELAPRLFIALWPFHEDERMCVPGTLGMLYIEYCNHVRPTTIAMSLLAGPAAAWQAWFIDRSR